MENYFYVIKDNSNSSGIGFFCHIKCPNKTLPVLITKKDIINEKDDSFIKVSINKTFETIELGDTTFESKEFNIKIMEIKGNIEDNINFFEFDDILYENESEMYCFKESIYLIHFRNQNDVSVSYGIINNSNNLEIL